MSMVHGVSELDSPRDHCFGEGQWSNLSAVPAPSPSRFFVGIMEDPPNSRLSVNKPQVESFSDWGAVTWPKFTAIEFSWFPKRVPQYHMDRHSE